MTIVNDHRRGRRRLTATASETNGAPRRQLPLVTGNLIRGGRGRIRGICDEFEPVDSFAAGGDRQPWSLLMVLASVGVSYLFGRKSNTCHRGIEILFSAACRLRPDTTLIN